MFGHIFLRVLLGVPDAPHPSRLLFLCETARQKDVINYREWGGAVIICNASTSGLPGSFANRQNRGSLRLSGGVFREFGLDAFSCRIWLDLSHFHYRKRIRFGETASRVHTSGFFL